MSLLTIVGALAPLASCRQVVGIGDTPPGASPARVSACGFAWSDGDCASCMQSSCCAQATACGKETACASAFDCIAACGGDEKCRAGCIQHGDATMVALGACQSRSCASACGLTCGGWGLLPGAEQLAHIESSPGCETCLTSTGCAELSTCMADEACLMSRFCGNSCLGYDLQCTGTCGYSAPQFYAPLGDAGLSTLSNPQLFASCTDACKPGSDWSCVSKLAWPTANKPSVTFRFYVYDFASGKPLSGVTVRGCSKSDPDTCADATPTVKSSSAGLVELPLNVEPLPFDGYIEMSLTGYVTYLFLFYPYVVEDSGPLRETVLGLPFLTQSLLEADYKAASIPFDPTLGTVAIVPLDCEGSGAPYVSFTGDGLGPSAVTYYFYDGIPTTHVNMTQPGPISDTGGFANVAPGVHTVESRVAGRVVSTADIGVRAGAFTVMMSVPTGAQ